ncbi:UNVERIFIED_CONTAM: hypothetical protein HDU68_007731 [Siphonaria sp. JEL0065]|nr:hypothetical protein HDU68_007731 [Siphonaria sp. JEL0065]
MRGGRRNNNGGGGRRAHSNAMDLDYDRGTAANSHYHPPPQQQLQQQQQRPVQQTQRQQQSQQQQQQSRSVTLLSIKNLHYNITAQDLVDAAIHLDGGKTVTLSELKPPKLEYDNADRSTGGAIWAINRHEDAVRVAHLLNNEVLDGIPINVSILSHQLPTNPSSVIPQNNTVNPTLRSVKPTAVGGINKKSKLLSRLGPPTVLSRLGSKKEDLLARLGPKTNGPTILGRLGDKPGAATKNTTAIGSVAFKKKRGGKK